MSFTDIIHLAKRYLQIGIIFAIIVVGLFLFGYFYVYKKKLNGKKTLKLESVLLGGSFFAYIFVVLAATLFRGRYPDDMGGIMPLFHSYQMAWHSASRVEWQNLILNILMFVPLGVFLPLIFKKHPRFSGFFSITVIGMSFSIFIETMQGIFNLGIVEVDDVLNNTLGVMLGYGIFELMMFLISIRKPKKKHSLLRVIGYQLPLVLTIFAFSFMYHSYQIQEFGNLPSTPLITQKVGEVTYDITFNENNQGKIYRTPVYTQEQLEGFASTIFEALGTALNPYHTSVYEETLSIRNDSTIGSGVGYHMWINTSGGAYSLSCYENQENNEKESVLTEEEIRIGLSNMSVSVPHEAKWIEQLSDSNSFVFELPATETKKGIIFGKITGEMTSKQLIVALNYNICEYEFVRDVDLLTEQEVMQQIEKGKFTVYDDVFPKNKDITVNSIDLIHEKDTKHFLQPVYRVYADCGGESWTMFVPAMRS